MARYLNIDSSLARRLLTAGVLITVVVLVIFWLPEIYVSAFLALVVSLASWEWARLSGFTSRIARTGYVAATVALLSLITAFDGTPWLLPTILGIAMSW